MLDVTANLIHMEPNTKPKTSPKDIFLNLGAIVALYTLTISLLNLLFSVINSAYPKILDTYNYYGSQSISLPVSVLIIFFPIYIFLMWLLEKGYSTEQDRKHFGVRKWLTYITLFITGIALAADFVTIIYYFIDGQELTMGFILKFLSVLVVSLGIFYYYISDVRDMLTAKSQKVWLTVSIIFIVASIVWGFVVLGSPRTQKLYKYDSAKFSDLENISWQVNSYYEMEGSLPESLSDLSSSVNYFVVPLDPQSGKPYEYVKKSASKYNLCAEFNFSTDDVNYSAPVQSTWNHPAGKYCFERSIPPKSNS